MTGSANPEDSLDASTSPGSDGERGSSTDTEESVRREAGGSFELLEHTSEIGFRAEGSTLEEAFEESGKAVFEVMTDIDELETEEDVELEVESEGLEALLYDFVDELIYITEVENLLLKEFDLKIKENGDLRLSGTGVGEKIGKEMRRQEVKAATYSNMKVEDSGEGWMIEMFLDV